MQKLMLASKIFKCIPISKYIPLQVKSEEPQLSQFSNFQPFPHHAGWSKYQYIRVGLGGGYDEELIPYALECNPRCNPKFTIYS